MNTKIKIFIADDEYHEQDLQNRFKKNMPEFNFIFESKSNNILKRLKENSDIKVLVLDLRFKEQEMQGEEVLREISSSQFKDLPIIVFTAEDSLKTFSELAKIHKIFDFVVKFKYNFDDLRDTLFEAATNEQNPYDLKGVSKNIKEVKRLIKLFAEKDQNENPAPVLIIGETGTGKELVAKSIHRISSLRRNKPFEARNIAEYPSELIASELFGHKQGSFTGADYTKKGAFELAKGGVLFLDEIGELPPHHQVKLLRVLQEKKIYPIGSEKYIDVSDVRVITATNVDIEDSLKTGSLRKDLFYRLNVCKIKIDSLNDRKDDIEVLVKYFILKYHNYNNKIDSINDKVISKMKEYYWDGNVRQLEKLIESAMIYSSDSEGNTLELKHFPELTSPSYLGNDNEISEYKKFMKKIAKNYWLEILKGKRPPIKLDDIDKEFHRESLGYLVGAEAINHFGRWLTQEQEQKYFGYDSSKSVSSRHLVSYFRRRGINSDKEILKNN